MSAVGTVLAVETEYASVDLAEDASAADTEIVVDSVSHFPPTGTLRLQGIDLATGDDLTEDIAYTAIDETTLVITLAVGLVNSYDADSQVTTLPLSPQSWATVEYDPEDEPTRAFVPEQFKTTYSPAFDDGDRDPGIGPEVVVDVVAGTPTIVRVNGTPSLLDGSAVNPDTTVPPAALTDGDEPSGSPTPTLEPFAVGGLRWSVTPVANADPVRFRVYADTVDPPTIDAAHLVDDTASLYGTFAVIDDVRLLPDDPTAPLPSYYVACVEYDADGDAPTSATSTAASPRRASLPDISADWGYFGSIEANQIASGSILTQLLNIGSFIEIDGENSYITIFGDAAHTQPLVQLRPDGSVFRGQVVADDVSVLNGLVLQGLLSHLAQSAGLTLDASVKDPATAPTLTVTPASSAWPAPPAGYESRGFSWDGTQWLRLIWKASTSTAKVEKITAGAVTSTTTLTGLSLDDVNSIVKVGSNWFVLGSGFDAWTVRKFSTAGAPVAISSGAPQFITTKRPALGTDGTNLLVASSDGTGTFHVELFDTALVAGATWTAAATGHPNQSFAFVGKDNFDYGASRVVIVGSAAMYTFTLSGTNLTEVSAKAVTLADNTYYGGFGWNGTSFYAADANSALHQYGSYYPAASEKTWVTYSDTDTGSGKHTKDSPPASVALVARRYVQAALGVAPDGAVTPKVYAGLATSLPADTALLLRPETITTRNILINPATAGGAALGAGDANTFGVGTPAWVKSQTGGLELYGDGTFWAPKFKVYATKGSRQSSAFNIGHNSTAPVNMNTFDGSGSSVLGVWTTPYYHWDSTNRCWVIDVAGVYSFAGGLNLAGNATGRREVSIRVNGATALFPWTRLHTVDANDVHINVARSKLPLLAGDTVDLGVFHNAGVGVNLDAINSWLSISRDGELAA